MDVRRCGILPLVSRIFSAIVKGAIPYEIYFSVCAHSGLLFSGRGAARRAAAAGACQCLRAGAAAGCPELRLCEAG